MADLTSIPRVRCVVYFDDCDRHYGGRAVHDSEDLCHRGFKCFRWLIDKYQPDYFIHGHIHRHFSDPSERVTAVDATKVVNTYGYNILEIEAGPHLRSNAGL